MTRRTAVILLVGSIVVALVVCRIGRAHARQMRRVIPVSAMTPPLERVVSKREYVKVTGYCNCGKCCSWKRSWFGFGSPVYTSGSKRGQTKKVGITASGTRAKRGTIAADPKVYPFGTRIFIPGYGYGTVEDVGGAIKGKHLDVWFPSHEEARSWGTQQVKISVLR